MDTHVVALSHVWLFATPWTVACQAPLSMGFHRQEHGIGLPFPPPGDLPNPGIKPASPLSASGFFTTEPLGKPQWIPIVMIKLTLWSAGYLSWPIPAPQDVHGISIFISPQTQWPLELHELSPKWLWGLAGPLCCCPGFLVYCMDRCRWFLPGFSPPGLALLPACPPHFRRVLFLNHRCLPPVWNSSLSLSCLEENVYILKHDLHGVCGKLNMSSRPLPSPNLTFILYCWYCDLPAVSWSGHLPPEWFPVPKKTFPVSLPSLCTPPSLISPSWPPTWLTPTHL